MEQGGACRQSSAQKMWDLTEAIGICFVLPTRLPLELGEGSADIWGVPKIVGFFNNRMGFSTKTEQHLGCEMGVPPFKETPSLVKQPFLM